MKPSPSWNTTLLLAAAALGCGLLAGWGWRGAAISGRRGATPQPTFTDSALEEGARAKAAAASKEASGQRNERVATPLPPTVAALQNSVRNANDLGGIVRALAISSRLTREEIPQALAMASGFDTERASIVKFGIVVRWCDFDPRGATEWALEQKGKSLEHGVLLGAAVGQWTEQDPAATRAWMEKLKPAQLDAARSGYFSAIGGRDPMAGLRELQTIPADKQEELGGALFKAWSSVDPISALQQAEKLSAGKYQDSVLDSVYSNWAATQPEAALASALARAQQSATKNSDSLVESLISEWAAREPEKALSRLFTLPETMQTGAIDRTIYKAMEANPDRTRILVEAMPPGPRANQAKAAMYTQLAADDPVEAAAAVEAMEDGDDKQSAIGKTGTVWANRDPAAAAKWMISMPEGSDRAQGMGFAMRQWADKDLVAAGEWLAQVPAGATYDEAAASYAKAIANQDNATALEWATSIGTPQKREEITRPLAEAWLKTDPAAARTWLQANQTLPTELRASLLRIP